MPLDLEGNPKQYVLHPKICYPKFGEAKQIIPWIRIGVLAFGIPTFSHRYHPRPPIRYGYLTPQVVLVPPR